MVIDERVILLILLSLFFIAGLFIGWCLVKKRVLLLIVGLVIFSPVFIFTIDMNSWLFTGLVVSGFLVHTAKPIYHIVRGGE